MKERMSKKKAAAVVIIAAAAAVILILALLFASGSKARDLSKQLDLGKRYLEEMDYDNALIAFNKAIEIDPKNVDAYIGAAEAYIGKGDRESAEKILEKGLENVQDSELLKKSLEDLTGEEVKVETPTSAAKASSSGTSSAVSSSAAGSSASSSSAETSASSSEASSAATSSATSSAESSQEPQQPSENPTSAERPAASSQETSENSRDNNESTGSNKLWAKADKTDIDVYEGEEVKVTITFSDPDIRWGQSAGTAAGGVEEEITRTADGSIITFKGTYSMFDGSESSYIWTPSYVPEGYETPDPLIIRVRNHYPRNSVKQQVTMSVDKMSVDISDGQEVVIAVNTSIPCQIYCRWMDKIRYSLLSYSNDGYSTTHYVTIKGDPEATGEIVEDIVPIKVTLLDSELKYPDLYIKPDPIEITVRGRSK